ncbi:MAG: glycosyltransferase family 1 protein [Nitrospirae bacterium]|nr:MAG: glycosyltransferase family 1 protein [Nitrospirota bacterium]
MRVGLDAGPALAGRGGIGQYVRGLIQGFAEFHVPHEFRLYVPKGMASAPALSEFAHINGMSWHPVHRWRWRWQGWRDRLDLYHGTNFKLQTRGIHGTVLTIHDLWLSRFPEYSKKLWGERGAFRRTRRRVWSAQRVIAVSQATARDLQELMGLPAERIRVVYHGVPPGFYPDHDRATWIQVKQHLGLPDNPYLLFMGGADPRKNHRLVYRVLSRAPSTLRDYVLVAVGSHRSRGGDLVETAREMKIAERVHAVGSVTTPVLRLLYSHATALVFPSLYEGFGFPVLEAMACGTPVITSRTTALPEVAGEAALLVDPSDEAELLQAIVDLVANEALRQRLVTKGFQQVSRFTWTQTAAQTLAVYEELCG